MGLLGVAWRRWIALAFLQRPMRSIHQLLLREHSRLQSRDRRVDAGVLLLSAAIKEQKSGSGYNYYGNSQDRANSKRSPLFVDCRYYLLSRSSIFLFQLSV